MVSKKNRKTAKPKSALAMMLIFCGLILAFDIGLHFYPLLSTTTPKIGNTIIVSNSPIPSGIVAYVPIYLNNPSNTTTASTVFINIRRNKYLPYLAYNKNINESFGKWWKIVPNQQLSNLEFYYDNSYPSGCMGMFFYEKLNYEILISNSSTILAMVQLPSSIAPNSNMTIYMGFKSD